MLGHNNKQLADALKQLSAAKYGRPKAIVEKEIFKRLTTEEPSRPALNSSSPFGNMGTAPKPSSISGQSSFFDEWLAKRRQPGPLKTPQKSQDVANSPKSDKKIESINNLGDGASVDYVDTKRNISSNSLDSKEVNSIADQLRRGLMKKEENDDSRQGASTINKSSTDGVLKHDDVIYIDKEGNMSYRDKQAQ
jgi:hypothetical protein